MFYDLLNVHVFTDVFVSTCCMMPLLLISKEEYNKQSGSRHSIMDGGIVRACVRQNERRMLIFKII